ncbi:MAG: hypothetical protein DDT31_00307 [Syntrophomonadaceae bacterium]|nr:hypothetical protein [Bacillota bacterium]
MYILSWTNGTLPGKSPITIPVAAAVSAGTSLILTGKGSANYGQIQQTNLLRLLENFADGSAPHNPTIGQIWYNSTTSILNVCTSIVPITWEPLSGIQVTGSNNTPTNPAIGDIWFEQFANSGFLYIYTGTGRYPPVNWDARIAGYYPPVAPPVAPHIGININNTSLSTPDFGEAFIHGFIGSTPLTNIDGQISINGIMTPVPRGVLHTHFPGRHIIVWDTTSTMVTPAGTTHFFAVRAVGDNRFEYDAQSRWVPVTPAVGMHVIGFIDVAETDDNIAPGIISAEVWRNTVPFNGSVRHFPPLTGHGAPGGWHQIWPSIEHHGARFEYDAMLEKVLELIGSPYTFGGNLAIRGLRLTDFQIVDAATIAQTNRAGHDSNLRPINDTSLIATEPSSDDWDQLLAAARWAVNRLDLPANMTNGISAIPFTQDGRVANNELRSLSVNDVRRAPEARRYFRRYGSITGARLYAETINTLNVAISQRYSIKGIAGQNSTTPTFTPDIATWQYVSYLGNYTGISTTFNVIHLRAENDEMLSAFINGGGAIDIKLDYRMPATPTGNDTLFQAFINNNNTIRITADKVRFFGATAPLTLTRAPVDSGMLSATGTFANIAATTSGASSIVITARRTPGTLSIRIGLTGPAISGQTALAWNIVHDTQAFGADIPFFPRPNAYVAGDNAGTDTVWVLQLLPPPPTVTFSSNVTTGASPLSVTFTYTGTSASLIEWDFTGDGVYDATGVVTTTVLNTPGTYMVRCRATNEAGQGILTRPTYITVT